MAFGLWMIHEGYCGSFGGYWMFDWLVAFAYRTAYWMRGLIYTGGIYTTWHIHIRSRTTNLRASTEE